MIIHYLHIFRAQVAPRKTNSPLVIDTDTILASPLSLQRLEAIAWRLVEVIKSDSRLKPAQGTFRSTLKGTEPPITLAFFRE